jgi:hypothetical protein
MASAGGNSAAACCRDEQQQLVFFNEAGNRLKEYKNMKCSVF